MVATRRRPTTDDLGCDAAGVISMPAGSFASTTSSRRALPPDAKAGALKILIAPATERSWGAAIVGAEAEEVIHVFAALMQAGATAHALVDMEAVHRLVCRGVQAVIMAALCVLVSNAPDDFSEFAEFSSRLHMSPPRPVAIENSRGAGTHLAQHVDDRRTGFTQQGASSS